MDIDTKEIFKISFGILSSEEIKQHAVVKIENFKITDDANGTVYDPRMGGVRGKCVTCELDSSICPGHMGYIDLKKPVIHPIFLNHVLLLLKCFCVQCHKMVLSRDHMELRGFMKYNEKRRFIEFSKNFLKVIICIHCNYVQPDYKSVTVDNFNVIYAVYDNKKVVVEPEDCLLRFENVTDEEVRLLGFDPNLVHPRNFVLTRFPVIPTCCRPYIVNDGSMCDDDLTYQLLEIIKNNALSHEKKYYNNLLFRIITYFNNSSKKAKHATTGRPIKGIKERIGGKDGHIRNNLLGKRVNQSARTVIGPDPSIDMETLIVPQQMANILTYPELIYKHNIDKIQEWFKNDRINYIIKKDGKKVNVCKMYNKFIIKHGDVIVYDTGKREIVMDTTKNIPQLENGTAHIERNGVFTELEKTMETNIEIGDVVYRKLQDGDYVMLNRQPTLHKASMMALKIKILPIKTLKINLAISKPFNCDFDGDEMNIHVPQSLEARIELEQLSTPKQCMINTQASKPNICIVQDSLTAMYLITLHANVPIAREKFFQIIMHTVDKKYTIETCYKFVDIVNAILPPNFTYKTDDLYIEKSKLIYGTLTKKYLGNSKCSLIKIINFTYGVDECVKFINNVQFVSNQWLYIYGFTIHAEDCLGDGKESGLIRDIVYTCLKEAEMHCITVQHEKIRENKIIACLSKAKDIGMKIAKNHLKLDNNYIKTVESGSKGDYFNIAQITGLLGQQIISNGRIHGTMNNHSRTIPHQPLNSQLTIEDKYKFHGFIPSSFEHGLDPIEFFFHSISGRKGVSDTALSTATSGYNMRRIVKLTEDITIQYDGTVRDNNKRLYQMDYNSNFDPTKLHNGKFF